MHQNQPVYMFVFSCRLCCSSVETRFKMKLNTLVTKYTDHLTKCTDHLTFTFSHSINAKWSIMSLYQIHKLAMPLTQRKYFSMNQRVLKKKHEYMSNWLPLIFNKISRRILLHFYTINNVIFYSMEPFR